MGRLSAFLDTEGSRLRAEAATLDAEAAREWCDAVKELLNQMELWIRESDPEGILRIFRETFCRSEAKLGYYETPALRVVVGNRQATIAPWARRVLGAAAIPGETLADVEGVVDMKHSASAHYRIKRIWRNGQYQWLIQNEYRVDPRRPWDAYPFDREAFEAALVSILE